MDIVTAEGLPAEPLCSFCHKTFARDNLNQRYCGKTCRRRAQKVIERAKRKKLIRYSLARIRVCSNPGCGQKFKIQPGPCRTVLTRRYCSDSCNSAHWRLKFQQKYGVAYSTQTAEVKRLNIPKSVYITCWTCLTPTCFDVRYAGKARFCGPRCRNIFKRALAAFIKRPSQIIDPIISVDTPDPAAITKSWTSYSESLALPEPEAG